MMWPGLPLAALTAVYTAFLFAQSKARDLWQNPLLPVHFGVQAMKGMLRSVSSWAYQPAAVWTFTRAL